MKINKEKLTKENIYKFLIDTQNKGLIINFLCLLILVIVIFTVPNLFVKLGIYYICWFLIVKFYDKAIKYLFRDIVNSSKDKNII